MTDQPERIFVRETSFLEETTFCGTFSYIKRTLDKLEKEGWEGIEWDENSEVFAAYKHRPETDEEQDKRLAVLRKEEKRKSAAQEKRRAQYETLRKEFGD
jgi:hypothetical protein